MKARNGNGKLEYGVFEVQDVLGVSGFFTTGDWDISLGNAESLFHARDTKRWKLLDGVCVYHYDLVLNRFVFCPWTNLNYT